MINIGNVRLLRCTEQTRLCADISMNGRGTTLWFGVATEQEDYLCHGRSDAFVMALLPTAMREGQDVHCDTPMSMRLHYQLEHYLIPTLAGAGDMYHRISIHAPLTAEKLGNKGGVGTGFSGGVDSLYTIMTHGEDSDYPLTHLALFNVGVFEGAAWRENFRKSCSNAQVFAREMGLELVGLDSNLPEVLPERFLDVYSFRNLAGALVLQGLFSIYLLSDGRGVAQFALDLHSGDSYDLILSPCARTESMTVYSSGMQVKRVEKIARLSNWSQSYAWLHPCGTGIVGKRNCGTCKKCNRDQVTLYALGALERYENVFDVEAFKKALPQKLGFLLARSDSFQAQEAIELWREKKLDIPPAAYIYEKYFRIAMQNLKEKHQ